MSRPFEPDERVLLLDQRGRRYLVKLQAGGTFHFHGGALSHDLVLGSEEGTIVQASTGAVRTCFRPRLSDFVLKMPRGAQVLYPKDIAAILMHTDVHPGARVLEAGTGSGALTIALARAVGPLGRVVTYEMREEFQEKAARNVETFFGKPPEWLEMRSGDLRQVAETGERFDQAILDMPEPWGPLPEVREVLEPGGVVCGYVPTTIQVQTFVLSLQSLGFLQVETFEILHRSWYVTDRSVRPDHRMVAHTGFITVGRRGSGGEAFAPPDPTDRDGPAASAT